MKLMGDRCRASGGEAAPDLGRGDGAGAASRRSRAATRPFPAATSAAISATCCWTPGSGTAPGRIVGAASRTRSSARARVPSPPTSSPRAREPPHLHGPRGHPRRRRSHALAGELHVDTCTRPAGSPARFELGGDDGVRGRAQGDERPLSEPTIATKFVAAVAHGTTPSVRVRANRRSWDARRPRSDRVARRRAPDHQGEVQRFRPPRRRRACCRRAEPPPLCGPRSVPRRSRRRARHRLHLRLLRSRQE